MMLTVSKILLPGSALTPSVPPSCTPACLPACLLSRRAVLVAQGAAAVRGVHGLRCGVLVRARRRVLRVRLVGDLGAPRGAGVDHELLAGDGHVPATP